jgi:NADH:ubiquinone oxidoreductase subunit 3 (subunit A)
MGIVTILIFVPILTLILLILSPLINVSPIGGRTINSYADKISSYECGFTAVPGQNRNTLTIAFYIVAILYLVFDLEIALMIPIVPSFQQLGAGAYSAIVIFILILTVGFVYEINSGAIN